MKYLITGLGNPGKEYENTRHNIGFKILDALANASNITFSDKRYGFVAEYHFKSRIFVLLKPTTFMNLSGRAVNYWLKKEKIPFENLLVINDDIALPFGTLRLKPKGGAGGHNGLRSIEDIMARNDYARLRFGIGENFRQGQQVDYVLSNWDKEEQAMLPEKIDICIQIIQSFGTVGLEHTMTNFNGKV